MPAAAPCLPLLHCRINNAELLSGLRKFATDKDFQAKWRAVKMQKKAKLAALLKERTGDDVNMDSMFDIHVRRRGVRRRYVWQLLTEAGVAYGTGLGPVLR